MKLNLGCGKDTKEGNDWLNIDIEPYEGVDMPYDLNEIPYPFPDGSIESIRAIDVLEHLDDPIAQLEEWWRICKPGARIEIRVPHYQSRNAYTDLTHKHFFTSESLDYFDPGKQFFHKYPRYSDAKFDVSVDYEFHHFIFPSNIIFNLRVLKH